MAHTLQAKLTDIFSNTSNSVIINLTQDIISPTLTNVDVPLAGDYPPGNNLDFVANYDSSMLITGSPKIESS